MMVYPYLINNGFYLYKDLINPYPPSFIYFLSHFSKLFNYSIIGYQLLTWLMVIVTDVTVFILTQKIYKNYQAAFASVLFFIIFSISFGANQLWFDLIQTPFILFSVYHLYLFTERKNLQHLDLSLLFALCAFFIKQQSIWLILFIVILTVYKLKSLHFFSKVNKTYAFIVLAVTIHLLIFLKFKTLPDLIYWTIYFPFFKASSMPGYVSLPTIKQSLIVAGLLLFFLPTLFTNYKSHKIIFVCGIFLIFFGYPRFDYFHLIPALSVFSILAGKNTQWFLKSKVALKALTVVGMIVLFLFSVRFFKNNLTMEVRFFEPEIISSATFLSTITNPKDKIYIQNGPDQILALAKRSPPKPWADEFPWYLEHNEVQKKVVAGIKNEMPNYVVFKPYTISSKYDLGSYMPGEIAAYLDVNYHNYYQISPTLWLKIKN